MSGKSFIPNKRKEKNQKEEKPERKRARKEKSQKGKKSKRKKVKKEKSQKGKKSEKKKVRKEKNLDWKIKLMDNSFLINLSGYTGCFYSGSPCPGDLI